MSDIKREAVEKLRDEWKAEFERLAAVADEAFTGEGQRVAALVAMKAMETVDDLTALLESKQ